MNRALPPLPLFEHGIPPQQTVFPPSPDTPSQRLQDPLSKERECLEYVLEGLAHRHRVIQRQSKEIKVQMGTYEEVKDLIKNQGLTIGDLQASTENLQRDIHRLTMQNDDLVSSHAGRLRELEQVHANLLAQAQVEARSEAEQEAEKKATEHEQEVEELNRTFGQEKVEHDERVDNLIAQIKSLQEEATKTAAIVDTLKGQNEKLKESNETHNHQEGTQTDRIAGLEGELATANAALEHAHEKFSSDTSTLQTELAAATAEAGELLETNKSLETKRSIDKIVSEQAKAARENAERQNIGLKEEIDGLRRKNLQIVAANLAAAEIRKDVAGAHREHKLREKELLDLKTSTSCLTTQLAASQNFQTQQSAELTSIKTRLGGCSEEVKGLQEKNRVASNELDEYRKNSADVAQKFDAEKDAHRKCEAKRAKEQAEVDRLTKRLTATKEATDVAEKSLAEVNETLRLTIAKAKDEKKKLLTAVEDVKVAEGNATKLFSAKQAAENELGTTRADLEETKRQWNNCSAKIQELEDKLERSRKRPEELQRSLNDTRKLLTECGSKLQNAHDRAAMLDVKNRELEQSNIELRKFKSEFEQFGTQHGMVAANPGTKRARDNDSREREWSSDSGHSPAKRPHLEPDSSAGASQRYDDRSSYSGPRGRGGKPNYSRRGNGWRGNRG